jgi:hypothetical protein
LPKLLRRSARRGKEVVHRRQVPAAVAGGDGEVFLDGQRSKNLAFLRYPADSGERAAVRLAARDVFAAPEDAARPTCV